MSRKLNVGCGLDYRAGFINIDGSETLKKVDLYYDFSKKSLLQYFEESSIQFILANDIVEHLFHWEAVRLLKDFYALLEDGGTVEIRVPDCEFIISNNTLTLEEKLVLMFGGQDVPQGGMDESRAKYPQYFCHKYGWSTRRMWVELDAIGFKNIQFKIEYTNLVATASK